MTITEVNTIQDLMNLDFEVKFSENFLTIEKNYSSLIVVEFPEEGFNITTLIKRAVKDKINLVESDEYIDLRNHLDDLKEILNIL